MQITYSHFSNCRVKNKRDWGASEPEILIAGTKIISETGVALAVILRGVTAAGRPGCDS